MFFPFFFGFGAHGGFMSGLMTLVLIMGALTVVGMILSRVAKRRLRSEGRRRGLSPPDYDDDYDEEDSFALEEGEELAVFARVSVAFYASERYIQEGLLRLAESGQGGTPEGDAYLLREACLLLARGQDAITRYFFEQVSGVGIDKARSLLEDAGIQLRSRFDRERIRSDAKGVYESQEEAEDDLTRVSEYLVVSVAVAFRPPILLNREVKDSSDLVKLIREIGSLGPERLLGLEVVWDPATPEDTLSEEDLDRDYPELLPI